MHSRENSVILISSSYGKRRVCRYDAHVRMIDWMIVDCMNGKIKFRWVNVNLLMSNIKI